MHQNVGYSESEEMKKILNAIKFARIIDKDNKAGRLKRFVNRVNASLPDQEWEYGREELIQYNKNIATESFNSVCSLELDVDVHDVKISVRNALTYLYIKDGLKEGAKVSIPLFENDDHLFGVLENEMEDINIVKRRTYCSKYEHDVTSRVNSLIFILDEKELMMHCGEVCLKLADIKHADLKNMKEGPGEIEDLIMFLRDELSFELGCVHKELVEDLMGYEKDSDACVLEDLNELLTKSVLATELTEEQFNKLDISYVLGEYTLRPYMNAVDVQEFICSLLKSFDVEHDLELTDTPANEIDLPEEYLDDLFSNCGMVNRFSIRIPDLDKMNDCMKKELEAGVNRFIESIQYDCNSEASYYASKMDGNEIHIDFTDTDFANMNFMMEFCEFAVNLANLMK